MTEGETPQETAQTPLRKAVLPQPSSVEYAPDTLRGKIGRFVGKYFKGENPKHTIKTQPPEELSGPK